MTFKMYIFSINFYLSVQKENWFKSESFSHKLRIHSSTCTCMSNDFLLTDTFLIILSDKNRVMK